MKVIGPQFGKNGNLLSVGMNNRAMDHAVPPGQLRNAVNVDFDNVGNVLFPRIGTARVYTGVNCHSWLEREDDYGLGLFVEGDGLKRLNFDYTAVTVKTVGNAPMSYCQVDETVYFANNETSGRYRQGQVLEWGVPTPYNQLQVTPIDFGDMHAGDYLVTLTWLANGEESGADASVRVTVPDGGGIRLSNFPAPPAFVDGVSVYVSSVNGPELYLYGDYPADTGSVDVAQFDGDVELQTQFMTKPQPKTGLTVHSGRIYWIDGKLVRFTEAQNYLLQGSGNYFPFEDAVTNIISTPGPLFVTTTVGIYVVNGIDSGNPTELRQVKNYGAPALRGVQYDRQNAVAYLMADIGMIAIGADGVRELHFERVVTPKFKRGCVSLIEKDGVRKLVSVCQDGQISRLQHSAFTSAEVARKGNGL